MDGDGFGRTSDVITSCTAVSGRVTKNGDGNDNDRDIHPGAVEILRNGKDDDCDGKVDETNCAIPLTVTTTGVSRTEAMLNWTAATNPGQWQVRYSRTDGDWSTLAVITRSARSVKLKSLKCATACQWQLRSVCSNIAEEYDKSTAFITSTCNTATKIAGIDKTTGEKIMQVAASGIWPNPTRGTFTLSIAVDETETTAATIQLLDLSGNWL